MDHYIEGRIAGIPYLELNPSNEPIGTVLLYHGWASSIESYSFFASIVSHWGYKVVIPELPYHGERGTLDYSDNSVLEQYFWNVVLQGVKEVEELTAELSKTGDKIGIIGHSTGGFIAAGAFSKVPSLRAAVVINGSCAWVKFEELLREKIGREPIPSDRRDTIFKNDPVSQIDFEDNRALLILHGKEDSTVPIESQRYFIDVMSNRSSGELHFIEYTGVNHQITLGMLQKSKEWLDAHLG
ncbi:alpha/beta fold hydrolase [Paenibacillus tarimensis]